MINVAKTIPELASIRQQNLEAEIIALLTERLHISAEEATKLYYSSKLSNQIANDELGMRGLDAHYLVEDLLENENLYQ